MRRIAILGTLLGGTASVLPYIEQRAVYPATKAKGLEHNPWGFKHPGERDLPYEKILLQTQDEKQIHGWLILQPNATEVTTLVYFHSNTGNRGYRLDHIEQFYRILGFNVFIFDYRGYGESEDTPTETGLMHDARAVLEYLSRNSKIDPRKLVVYGRSLGGAVGIYAASVFENVRALIVENTFLSIPKLVVQTYYPVGSLLSHMLSNEWPSAERVKHIQCPILFISGQQDKIVPPEHMHELYSQAEETIHKELKLVPAGTHNNIRTVVGDAYFDWIQAFLSQSGI